MANRSSIRAFRHKVSVLKKQGLIPASIDARSAKPTSKSRGKKLSTIIERFDDVTSGKATAVKIPKGRKSDVKRAGYEVVGDRVIIPHAATESVSIKRGEITLEEKATGIQRVILPIKYQNLPQWFRDIEANADEINRMKRSNEYFGIRFYGGQRANFFSSIQGLIAYFREYSAVTAANTRKKQNEVYQHLEIIKFTHAAARQFEREIESRPRRGRRSLQKERERAKEKRSAQQHDAEWKKKLRREQTAARNREYRARVRKNKAKHKKVLAYQKAYRERNKRK